jgi:hypothetical protein
MRIWDVAPEQLCRAHLLGEHRELHALWSVLTTGRRGYARHPETLRWQGKLAALRLRHEALVDELQRRGYQHHSPLDARLATGATQQDLYVHSITEQIDILRAKGCDCRV